MKLVVTPAQQLVIIFINLCEIFYMFTHTAEHNNLPTI